MLFECFGLMLLAAALGSMLVICYRQGLKDGRRVQEGKELEPVLQLTASGEEPDPDPESARYDTLLKNIEAYDGTGAGQREVAP